MSQRLNQSRHTDAQTLHRQARQAPKYDHVILFFNLWNTLLQLLLKICRLEWLFLNVAFEHKQSIQCT